ncbi:hypothetical protein D3C75_429270 [compost metagenome]
MVAAEDHMSPERIEVVRHIDDLLESHCASCEAKTEFNRKHGGNTSFITKHCSQCQIGIQLADLGQQLTVRPRKKIELIPEGEKVMGKFTMSAEEYFAERATGKTLAQIAKEQGVSEVTVYNHMDKWAKEGKLPGPSVEQLPKPLREKDTEQRPATELELLDKAEREIERLTEEVEHWKGHASNEVALSGKANEQLTAEIERLTAERDELLSHIAELETEQAPVTATLIGDPVNHPAHYTAGAIECIDAIEAATAQLSGKEAYSTGQIIKYVWRWRMKGGAEDLQKARWYLDRLIGAVEVAKEA